MRPFAILINLLLLVLIFSQTGCYHTYEASKVETDTIPHSLMFPDQAKAYLINDNIIIFRNGFSKEDDYLIGQYQIFDYKGNFLGTGSKVSVDSIVTITQYQETTSGGMYFASTLNIFWGAPLTALAVYCLACPKCCFGSCPTVYVPSDNGYVLQAELFSKCISRQLEENDLDKLYYSIPSSGEINLRITNEALETHYINKFNLYAVTHSKGIKIYQNNKDEFVQIKDLISSGKIFSSSGNDISELLNEDDNKYFRSDADKILELRKSPVMDFIDISTTTSPGKDKIKMLIKYRNTLLTTTLLYDVVIGSQGINALEWTQKMNEDRIYAMQFKAVYDMFSGIFVEVNKNNTWIEIGKFQDAGPINWKYSVVEIPVENDGGIVEARLKFIPDNVMIDYIAFDTTDSNENFTVEKINPLRITDYTNQKRNDISEFINEDDNRYLITIPGDCYFFHYDFKKPSDKETSLFIESKGYYNEWIRGNWIKEKNTLYSFNLFDIQGTLNKLVDSWLENKDLLEQEFFNSRIPLREAK